MCDFVYGIFWDPLVPSKISDECILQGSHMGVQFLPGIGVKGLHEWMTLTQIFFCLIYYEGVNNQWKSIKQVSHEWQLKCWTGDLGVFWCFWYPNPIFKGILWNPGPAMHCTTWRGAEGTRHSGPRMLLSQVAESHHPLVRPLLLALVTGRMVEMSPF